MEWILTGLTRRLAAVTGCAISAVAAGVLLAPAIVHAEESVLRVALAANLNTLNPARSRIGEEYVYNFLVFNGLTRMNERMVVEPDLAEHWEASDDLTTWTFTLRPRVFFHNGNPLTTRDVKATFETILDPATGSSARANLQVVDRIDVVDEQTIRFVLKFPYAEFAELLSERQARIVPFDAGATLATNPIGTGPFRFVSFRPGDRLTLARFDQYFEPDRPKLAGVELRIIPESAAAATALTTGEIDVYWLAPVEVIEQVLDAPDIETVSTPTATWDVLVMRSDVPPFNDRRVRQAVAAAIDKQEMIDVALFGQGARTHSPIPPSHPSFHGELPFVGADLDRARALLAEAGLAQGFEIPLYIPAGRPTRERLGIAAQAALARIGIQARVQRIPWDKFIGDIEGKANFYVDGFFARPTIDTAVYPWYHSFGSWNPQLWHYSNPEMDQLLDQARQTAAADERADLYRRFQVLAADDVPGVIPYVVQFTNAYRSSVRHLGAHPMMYLDLRDVTIDHPRTEARTIGATGRTH